MNSHKDLIVWQKSVALACKVYAASRLLPRDEHSGLQNQLRCAAVAVASCIAEGSGSQSRTQFVQALYASRRSLAELETLYVITTKLVAIQDARATTEEIYTVGRLLNGLIRNLVSSDRAAHARACAPQPITTGRPPHPHRTHT